MLNQLQKIRINGWLVDKETIKLKRSHNLKEVDKLKEMLKTENNQFNYALLLDSIKKGKALVSTQTTRLGLLSLQNIANRVGVDYSEILRYERSSTKGGYVL